MDKQSPVEVADRLSRKRAILIALAAIAFLVSQALTSRSHAGDDTLLTVGSVVLLLLLATGGGLLHQTKVRALMNDDVSRDHHRTAIGVGFWTAMIGALVFSWIPGMDAHSVRQAMQFVVTLGTSVAMLMFAVLELRAHRDA